MNGRCYQPAAPRTPPQSPRAQFLADHSAAGSTPQRQKRRRDVLTAVSTLMGAIGLFSCRSRGRQARAAGLQLPALEEPVSMTVAAAAIQAFCPATWINATRAAGAFLYRGEGDRVQPVRLNPPPDLLNGVAYGEKGAAYFAALDRGLEHLSEGLVVPRLGAGHLCGSAKAASLWGHACSIWPLGTTTYAWPRTSAVFWEGQGPGTPISEVVANQGLEEAIRQEHEVLFQSEFGWLAVPLDDDMSLLKKLRDAAKTVG